MLFSVKPYDIPITTNPFVSPKLIFENYTQGQSHTTELHLLSETRKSVWATSPIVAVYLIG